MSDCGSSPCAPTAGETHLAEVVSVADLSKSGSVKVRLLGNDGVATQDAIIDAQLCVPFAGKNRGAFMAPDVGDQVVVSFIWKNPERAIVLGSVWNAKNAPPENIGGDGSRVDRWSFVGKDGTRVAIVEENGNAQIHLETRSGGQPVASIVVDRNGGGKITFKAGQTELVLDTQGLKLTTPGNCDINCMSHAVTAATVDVQSALASFSGVVDAAAAVQTAAVLGTTYTPGAGNVW